MNLRSEVNQTSTVRHYVMNRGVEQSLSQLNPPTGEIRFWTDHQYQPGHHLSSDSGGNDDHWHWHFPCPKDSSLEGNDPAPYQSPSIDSSSRGPTGDMDTSLVT